MSYQPEEQVENGNEHMSYQAEEEVENSASRTDNGDDSSTSSRSLKTPFQTENQTTDPFYLDPAVSMPLKFSIDCDSIYGVNHQFDNLIELFGRSASYTLNSLSNSLSATTSSRFVVDTTQLKTPIFVNHSVAKKVQMQLFPNIKFCTVQARDITYHVHLFFLGSDTTKKNPYFSHKMLAVVNAALNFARLCLPQDAGVTDTIRQSFSRLTPFHSTVNRNLAFPNHYGYLDQDAMKVFVQRFFEGLWGLKSRQTTLGRSDVFSLTGMNFGQETEQVPFTLLDMADFAEELFNHHCFAFSAAGIKSLFQLEQSTFELESENIGDAGAKIDYCIQGLVSKLHNHLNLEMQELPHDTAKMGIYFDFGIEIQTLPGLKDQSTFFDMNNLSSFLDQAMSCTQTIDTEPQNNNNQEGNHLLEEIDFFEELDNGDGSEVDNNDTLNDADPNILDRESILMANEEIKTTKWLHHSSIKKVGGVNSGSVFLLMKDDNNDSETKRKLQPTRTSFNLQGCQGYIPYLKYVISKSTTKKKIKKLMGLADNVQVALADSVRRSRKQKHAAAQNVIEILDILDGFFRVMKMDIPFHASNPCRYVIYSISNIVYDLFS